MESKPRLSTPTKLRILEMRMNGSSVRDIAEELECSKNAVSYTWNKYQETGNIGEREHSGRPKKLDERDDRELIKTVQRDPCATSKKVANEFNKGQPTKKHISPSYVRKLYQTKGFNALVCPRKWLIEPENKAIRYRFAQEYLIYGGHFWQSIIFSDESWLSHGTGRKYVRLRKSQSKSNHFTRVINQRGPKVMVWGAVCCDGRRSLEILHQDVNGKTYKEVLERNLLRDFPELAGGNLFLQQDNAPAHRAQIVTNYLNNVGIEKLRWPSQSPDLNIIENLWAYLKRGLKDLYDTEEELIKDIHRLWESIEDHYIKALFESMGERLEAVITSKGGPTKY